MRLDQKPVENIHTDRIKQHQLLSLTEKNVSVCPYFQIIEQLKNN